MKNIILGIQILVVAFASLIIGPLVAGLDISLGIFAAGVCTLIYHLLTNGKIPLFLGGGLSVLAATTLIVNLYGQSAFLGASLLCSFLYIAFGMLFLKVDKDIIDILFPSAIRGSIVVLIGFTLLSVAVRNMISFSGDGVFVPSAFFISIVVVYTLFYFSNYAKGVLSLIPVIIAIAVGYVVTLIIAPQTINFTNISEVNWIQLPWADAFKNNVWSLPNVFNLNAILILTPLFLATIAEHIGSLFMLDEITKQNFIKGYPGITKSSIAFGVANFFSSFLGTLPLVGYAEVIGTMTATKEHNPIIIQIAAVLAIIISFFGKFNGILATIPTPVMGGVMFVVFGGIGVVGIKILSSTAHLDNKREVIVSTVVLSTGIGNLQMSFGTGLKIEGIALAVVIGVITNLILLGIEKVNK